MYSDTRLMSTLHALNACVCVLTALRDWSYYHPPSADEKTEAQKGDITWSQLQVRRVED